MKNFYVAALFFVGINIAQAQVYDTGEYAQMTDVSNDGVAVGNVYNAYHVKWTEAEGTVNIGELTSGDFISGWTNVTSDGKFISGTMTNPASSLDEMGRFNVLTNTWSFLGGLGAISSPTLSTAWGMADNGAAVVGLGYVSVSTGHAIKWSQATGIVDLGSTVTNRSSRANSINADGSIASYIYQVVDQNNKKISVTYGFNKQNLPTFAEAHLNGKKRFLPINLGRSDDVDTVFGDEDNYSIMSSELRLGNYHKSSINIQDASSKIVYKGCDVKSIKKIKG